MKNLLVPFVALGNSDTRNRRFLSGTCHLPPSPHQRDTQRKQRGDEHGGQGVLYGCHSRTTSNRTPSITTVPIIAIRICSPRRRYGAKVFCSLRVSSVMLFLSSKH